MNDTKILVVGSMNMDFIVTTNHFPSDGETIMGMGFSTAPGGKGANQAVQAAKLGAQVDIIGRVGKDIYRKVERDLYNLGTIKKVILGRGVRDVTDYRQNVFIKPEGVLFTIRRENGKALIWEDINKFN